MKRVLALMLVFVFVFAFAACNKDDRTEVEKAVDDQREIITNGIVSGLESQLGECEADIRAEGNDIIVDIKVMSLTNVSEDVKSQMQANAEAMESSLDATVEQMRNDVAELNSFTVNICDAEGNVLASATGR